MTDRNLKCPECGGIGRGGKVPVPAGLQFASGEG
jgi:hypothetical protein